MNIDFSLPDWYLKLAPVLREYFWEYEKNQIGKPDAWFKERFAIVQDIADRFAQNTLTLGIDGEDFDIERKLIDTIVIHHTHTDPTATIYTLEAYGIIRLYTPNFANPKQPYYGQPLWSGHFFNGKQTFVAYHYLIWPDGSVVNPLKNQYIGWQAGNWDMNCRSIAIAFVDNLDTKPPTPQALAAAKRIIAKYPGTKLLAHSEVNQNTVCPGKLFSNWKQSLL